MNDRKVEQLKFEILTALLSCHGCRGMKVWKRRKIDRIVAERNDSSWILFFGILMEH
jgi:hypothetical protein